MLAPASNDPPSSDIRTASEPREIPVGRLAFVSDSGLSSVYEFDLGRMRFIGPAPSTTAFGFGRLPADPTTVGHRAPQRGAVVGSTLYLGGGGSGALIVIPITPTGLGEPTFVQAPPMTVMFQGRAHPLPDLDVEYAVGTASGEIVAIGRSLRLGAVVALIYDPARGAFVKSSQLTDGTPQIVVASTGGVVVVTNHQIVDTLDDALSVHHVAELPGIPHGAAVIGATLYVSIEGTPTRLVSLDLKGGSPPTTIDIAPGKSSGAVATDGSSLVFWAQPAESRVRRIDVSTKQAADFFVCKNLTSMAWTGQGSLLATCVAKDELASFQSDGSGLAATPAGYFPIDVVVEPNA